MPEKVSGYIMLPLYFSFIFGSFFIIIIISLFFIILLLLLCNDCTIRYAIEDLELK